MPDFARKFIFRPIHFSSCLCIALALCASRSYADDSNITADRPGLSDSSLVIAPTAMQVETGIQNDFGRDHERDIIFPSLFRFGISDKFEARIESNVFSASQSGFGSDRDTSHGLTPVSVGAKYEFYDDAPDQFTMGFIGRIYPPSGSSAFRSRRVTSDLRFVTDKTIDQTTLTLNVGAALYEDDDRHDDFAAVIGAATVTQNLSDSTAVFIDSGMQQPEREDGRAAVTGDTGITYLLSPNIQLDLEAGTNLAGATSASIFWGAGISWRFFTR